MTADNLMNMIQDAGLRPFAYSGRGMYGEHCVACVLSEYDRGRFLPPKGRREDSLGCNTVVYWPSVKAPEWLGG